jgi:uncharacterized protein
MLLRFALSRFAGFAAFLLVPTLAVHSQETSPARPYVETTGFGERSVTPDRATVMINIMSKAPSAAGAAAENSRIQLRVMDTLRTLGLGNAASTASYNVGPNYEPEPTARGMRPVGYVARTSIRVRLTELSSVGRVIDATLARGASGVDGVFFESSAASEARRAAIAEATATARADAEALARALGGSLGALVSASTSFSGIDPRRMAMSREMAGGYVGGAPTQIRPTELVINASVIVRWHFAGTP